MAKMQRAAKSPVRKERKRLPVRLRDLNPRDFDTVVWRYMSFSKFICMMTFQSLWFSTLEALRREDDCEGRYPKATKARVDADNQKWKEMFDPEFHDQIDGWTARNEDDAGALLIANCWFIGDDESVEMWNEYAPPPEGIAIKSTIGRLIEHVHMWPDDHVSHIGRVHYVDHRTHEMDSYAAAQGIERAFLKKADPYRVENELRLATMNWKHTRCANPDGTPYTAAEVAGAGMNNFGPRGLNIGVNIDHLFTEVIVSPGAYEWFVRLVRRIVSLHGVSAEVRRSRIRQLTRSHTRRSAVDEPPHLATPADSVVLSTAKVVSD